MSLNARTDPIQGKVEAIQGEAFHTGINNGQVTLMIETQGGEYYFLDATAEIARDIASTLIELAAEVEKPHE